MSLFSFIKEAGEKLFGINSAAAADSKQEAGAIVSYIQSLNLPVSNLDVQYDAASQTVTLRGEAPDQATREKVLLAAGNVHGVASVDDQMSVARPEPEAKFHTVAKGDTLSAIAKTYYGNANKYMVIFEANQPMLSHPDKIYPGQVLRIPPQA
jgi:nucleoid-associated protein YgaU